MVSFDKRNGKGGDRLLRVLTGRAKSGKSEQILREIRARGDEGGGQILIVPQYATHGAEIDLCRACGDTAGRHAEVLSFESLAERVLTLVRGGVGETLDAGGKLLTMQKTLQEVSGQLHVFRRSFLKSAFLTNLIALADEFRSYRVTPEELLRQSGRIGGGTGEKLRDLALITGVYEAKLRHDLQDARDPVSRMADCLAESGYVRGKDLYLDGISYFNAQEETALRVMLREAGSVTISLLYDPDDRSGIFDETAVTIARLRELARETGAAFSAAHCPPAAEDNALNYLERHFFGPAAAYAGDSGAISVCAADSAYDEAEYVAGEIRRLAGEGFRYRDIAITCRNLGDYEQTLETALRRYEIPYFLNRRSDILEKPAVTLLLGALDAVSGGYEYEDMFRWLKTGLAGLSDEECDALENYAIRWDIRGSMWIREQGWRAHPEGYGAEWTEESRAALDEINALRERVREPLSALAAALRGTPPAREMVTGLYRFLETLKIPEQMEEKVFQMQETGALREAEEYSQLWQILCRVMDQFVEILGDSPLEGAEFARLFRLILTQYCVGAIPVSLDQVKIGPMDQNDRQTVRCLFLMGANDHVIPAVEGGGGLLTEEDRESLCAEGLRLAPGERARFSMELQNLYAALAQPTERLTVTYPTGDVAGSELRPAFLVTRMLRLFPGLAAVRGGEQPCAAPIPALEAAGSAVGGELWNYLEETGRYAEQLAVMRRAAAVERGRLSPAAVETLYGRRLRMTASRTDKVRQCHYAYFLQYGLRAKERRESAFDAPEIGTFLHYVLEHVTRDAQKAGGLAAVGTAERRRLTEQYVDRFAEESLDRLRDRNARFRYLFARLKQTALRIVESLAAELAESDFVPMAFELSFGEGGDLPAITIAEGDATLQLSGKVDRVDGWLHEGKLYLRVVDYKTGKKAFDLADVRYGLNLQMLLYLFTLKAEGERYFHLPVESAGVLYMPARDVLMSAERDIDEEALEKALGKELRRSGLVLSEPAVLRAMEHSALETPCYLPLRVGRDGSLAGSLASAERLGLLGRHVERQLRRIVRELTEGNIDADPCCRSEADAACQFCEFRTACHFEDGRGTDHLTYIRPVADAEEFWEELRRENGEGGDHV